MHPLLLLGESLGRGGNVVASEGVRVVGADRQGDLGGSPAPSAAGTDDGQHSQQQDAATDTDDDPHPGAAPVQA